MKNLKNKVMALSVGAMATMGGVTAFAEEHVPKSMLNDDIKSMITNLSADMSLTAIEWVLLILGSTIGITMIGIASKKGIGILIKRVKKVF